MTALHIVPPHAALLGVSQVPEPRRFRVIGMTLTFIAIIAAAVRLLLAAF